MAIQGKAKMVAVVDDDDLMRDALLGLLKSAGLLARAFASADEFLKSGHQHDTACLITDIRMPGMSGLELQAQLNAGQMQNSDHLYNGARRRENAHASYESRRSRVPGKAVRRRGPARECSRRWRAKPGKEL
jgi:DNA-binding NtrC family response regulator